MFKHTPYFQKKDFVIQSLYSLQPLKNQSITLSIANKF